MMGFVFEIVRGLFAFVGDVLGALGIDPVVVGVTVVVVGLGVGCFPLVWQKLIVWVDAKKRRIPVELQQNLTALLSSEVVLKFYAPDDRYIRDLAPDEKKPVVRAWLSPHRRAVRAAVKRHGRVLKGQAYDAVRQVKAAAGQVNVRLLSDDEGRRWTAPDEAPLSVYAVELSHAGRSPQEVGKMLPALRSQLKAAGGLFPIDDGDPTKMTVVVCEKKVDDALVKMKRGAEWFEENPAKTPESLPMAYTATGAAWSMPIHHTLIYGMTGAGKSGPLLGAIRQLADFVEAGTVKLWAIDPKETDLALFRHSGLFAGGIASERDDAIDLINRFYAAMKERNRTKKIDLAAGQTGQRVKPSKATPLNLLMIDEFFSLRADLDSDKAGKAALKNLQQILAQGRSSSFYVMAATQFADLKSLEGLRQNFANAVVLRQESAYLNDLMLGEKAGERGYDSTAIPASNAANGYRYSGIGYVKGESGNPQKVRFAYLSEKDVASFILAHPGPGVGADSCQPHATRTTLAGGPQSPHRRLEHTQDLMSAILGG